MASHQDQFTRGSPDRASHNRYKAGSGSSQNTQGQDLELIRQRARRAADFYHQSVQGSGSRDVSDTSMSSTDCHPADPYRGSPEHGEVPPAKNGKNNDAYYPQNLRAGFIDIRNSYSEKRRTKFTAYPGRSVVKSQDKYGKGYDAHGEGGGHNWGQDKIYRSNSSLELESLEYIDDDRSPLRRDYGSTSSLDMVGSGPGTDGFFHMLKDYRNRENPDQRAPAPPQMHEVLRGNVSSPENHPSQSANGLGYPVQPIPGYMDSAAKVSNGMGSLDEQPSGDPDGSQSPKTKHKSQKVKDRKQRSKTVVAETSGGLFRRKRPLKSDSDMARSLESSSDSDLRLEERQKRKAFVHYDCQSISFCLSQLIKRRLTENEESASRQRNTTTGASAASGARGTADGQENLEDSDDGDGNSNDSVLSCPHFRNELGGEEQKSIALNIITAQKQVQQLLGNQSMDTRTLMRPPVCNGVSVLDMSVGPHGDEPQALFTHNGLVFEYVDQGAYYYRNFFFGMDHQNFFGIEDTLGPLAISIKREKLDEQDRETPTGKQENAGHCYQYRIIVRMAELQTLRGSVLEEAIPSSTRLSNTRGLPAKDLLEYVLPELNLSSLRLATPTPKTSEQLMKLDEQGIFKSYKFGVLLCKSGQCTEEDMYNNQHASPAFQEFLNMLGEEKRLKGFEKYRGGLDTKTDSTGTHCLYRELHGYEIIFHVSTMLPFSPNNKQQLLRKRHIGNDIVTLVFQEPGSKPFTPKSVRSQFQHVFIIIRAHNPNTSNVKYSMSISRAKVVPPFGPTIPDSVLFNRSTEFAEFLLTKAINAENAVHRSKKLAAMAMRTRQEYLRDLALNFTSSTPIDSGSKLSKFSLGSGRRKEKAKSRTFPDVFAKGAVIWNVLIEDFGQGGQTDCFLGIAAESLVVVDVAAGDVIFTVPTRAVIGWTPQGNSIRLYYHRGECILLQTYSEAEEIREILDRLKSVTDGCETVERTMQKDSKGQLGFHVYFEGIVSNVEPQSLAWAAGLRAGSRLVEICKDSTATLTHDQMLNLLRNASTVKLVYIPPHEDGTARRGQLEEIRPNLSALYSPQQRTESAKDLAVPDDYHQGATTRGSSGSRYADHYRPNQQHRSEYLQNRQDYDNSPQSTLDSRHSGSFVHTKQSSHDSGASRSSGQGSSEKQGSRTDVRSVENLAQSTESRRRPPDLDAMTQSQSWKVYPAYNRDYVNTQGLSPRSEQSFWQETNLTKADLSDQHVDGGYYSNNSSASRPQKNNTYTSQKHNNVGASFSYNSSYKDVTEAVGVSPDRPQPKKPAESVSGLLAPASVTNVAQGSDSVSSVETLTKGAGSAQRSRGDDGLSDKQSPSSRPEQSSPSGRRRQVPQHRRSFLESSPHGSNHSSPKASRHLTGVLSEENLARLRPGARVSPPKSNDNTFREDLMRLIDPDLSFAGSDTSPKRDVQRVYREGQLHRTRSDDSICASSTLRPSRNVPRHALRHAPADSSGDVILTARPARAVLKTPPGELTSEQKLSPRAILDAPTGLAFVHRTSPASVKKRTAKTVLGERASGGDWSNLVDAANAFETTELLSGKASSMGVIATHATTSASKQSHTMGHKPSKSTDKHKSSLRSGSPGGQGSGQSEVKRRNPSAERGASSRTPPSRPHNGVPWRSSGHVSGPIDSLQRIQELEATVTDLEEALEREQKLRGQAEAEVDALREDNLRLQEESHTAAAQLRKFTEWFFNNIDQE